MQETGLATIWRVARAGGAQAALKLYHSKGMGNEAPGHGFLSALNGHAAARVYAQTSHAALMEWLDGPSLGDLSRAGQDDIASRELVAVATAIHANPVPVHPDYPQIEDWFAALFTTGFAPDCPVQTRRDILHCQTLARDLFARQHEIRPLHGDLHHDNIRLGDRGYCAFDAKGVLGPRIYELANAVRNPKGVPDLIRDPSRIRSVLKVWSTKFQVSEAELLDWATVKTALSIVWRSKGQVSHDPEFDLLARLIGLQNT